MQLNDAQINILAARAGFSTVLIATDGGAFARFACALWAEAQKAAVPSGWKLVPVEPTEAMLRVGADLMLNSARDSEIADGWVAMLSAAPQPPEK